MNPYSESYNDYTELEDGSVEIELAPGIVTVVDAGDWPSLSDRTWRIHTDGYVVTGGGRPRGSWSRMHRELAGALPGQFVDHIDRDPLNNRQANLRITTASGNSRNRGIRGKNATGFKGVNRHPRSGRYNAQYGTPPNRVTVGWFDTAEDAARAYDRAITEAYGDYAVTNESLGLITGT